jgi:hypothetical protein
VSRADVERMLLGWPWVYWDLGLSRLLDAALEEEAAA